MNILIISYDFNLEAGGIQNTSYLLVEEISKYANIFALSSANGNVPLLPHVKTFRSRYSYKSGEELLYEKDATDIVERVHINYKIDYVLVVQYSYSTAAYNLKRKYNVPYGIMAHGNEVMGYSFHYIKEHPRSRFKDLLKRKKLFDSANHIFTNTNFTKDLVKRITKNPKIYVINPPISMMPKNSSSLSDKSGFMLSIGRIVERKGYQNLIKALPQILEKHPNKKYVIAGSGEYELQLQQLVKELNVEKFVIFKGRISENEKDQLLSTCSLFVMPSYTIKKDFQVEGFGISLIEANAHGKFVISTRSGGIAEAVKEGVTGLLVGENDVEELANAVIKFYNSDFDYNSEKCIEWSKCRHISIIARNYFDIISGNS